MTRPSSGPSGRTEERVARWNHVQELLDLALELGPRERDELLAQRGTSDPGLEAEVRSLLRHVEGGTAVLDAPPGLPGALREQAVRADGALDASGRTIGPYRLLERLGTGGMGTVYLAERTDDVYRSKVALKLLHPGLTRPDVVRRFEREREILAQLRHPHIARLLDGGTTEGPDGAPFLVMELVDGDPIDRWCDERRLDIDARLRLFVLVCRAVQAAHRHLVVHRDLKPSNLLVRDDGEPVLVDFGIAKLLSPEEFPRTVDETLEGHGPLTPAYASPEQLRGEALTTATDVFSLGVVLHELLTGTRPRTGELKDLAHLLPESSPPPRPSSVVAISSALRARARASDPRRLQTRLSGDLDTIVLRALHTDPGRRYSSAEALADDIERHLEGLPIEARPDELAYRAGKFVRRHPVAVSATVTAFVVLVALVTLLWTQRQALVEERDRSGFTSDFLADLFTQADPLRDAAVAGAADVTARELLDVGAERLESLEGSPAVKADLLDTMGRSYYGLGAFDAAERLLRRSLALSDALEPERAAAIRLHLGAVLADAGRYAEAEEQLRAALLEHERLYESPHAALVDARAEIGSLVQRREQLDDAERHYRRAMEEAEQLELSEARARLLEQLATVARRRAEGDAAEALLRKALELRRSIHGPRHPQVARTLHLLAATASETGDLEEAEKLALESLQIFDSTVDPGHSWRVVAVGELGKVLNKRGRQREARQLLEQAIEQARSTLGERHLRVAWLELHLSDIFLELDDPEQAEAHARRSLAHQIDILGEEHRKVALARDLLGRILARRGKDEDAERELLRAAESLRRSAGPEHPLTATTLGNLAYLAHRRGDLVDALTRYREALGVLRSVYDDRHPTILTFLYNVAYIEHRLGRHDEALASYDVAESAQRAAYGERHADIGLTLANRANLENELERHAEAEASARRALSIVDEALPPLHVRRLRAVRELAKALDAQGRETEAIETLEPVWRTLRAERPEWAPTRDLGALLADLARRADRPALAREVEDSAGSA